MKYLILFLIQLSVVNVAQALKPEYQPSMFWPPPGTQIFATRDSAFTDAALGDAKTLSIHVPDPAVAPAVTGILHGNSENDLQYFLNPKALVASEMKVYVEKPITYQGVTYEGALMENGGIRLIKARKIGVQLRPSNLEKVTRSLGGDSFDIAYITEPVEVKNFFQNNPEYFEKFDQVMNPKNPQGLVAKMTEYLKKNPRKDARFVNHEVSPADINKWAAGIVDPKSNDIMPLTFRKFPELLNLRARAGSPVTIPSVPAA